jgi:hypothetical protein
MIGRVPSEKYDMLNITYTVDVLRNWVISAEKIRCTVK